MSRVCIIPSLSRVCILALIVSIVPFENEWPCVSSGPALGDMFITELLDDEAEVHAITEVENKVSMQRLAEL